MNIINKMGYLVVIGGIDEKINKLNDAWIFHLIKGFWFKINTLPSIDETIG
jgi:hypothetical protein